MVRNWRQRPSAALHTPDRSPLTLMGFLHLELAMYRWHLCLEKDGKKDLGWLYNSYYSLVQQIIRCDPLYYLVYCCLHGDNATTLVSFPYYMKYITEGNRTGFRLLDQNLALAASSDTWYKARFRCRTRRWVIAPCSFMACIAGQKACRPRPCSASWAYLPARRNDTLDDLTRKLAAAGLGPLRMYPASRESLRFFGPEKDSYVVPLKHENFAVLQAVVSVHEQARSDRPRLVEYSVEAKVV